MRTTVDLPPALHQQVQLLAAERGQSMSATVVELAARGLNQLGHPLVVEVDQTSGFPVLRLGRIVTSEEVAAALDEQ